MLTWHNRTVFTPDHARELLRIVYSELNLFQPITPSESRALRLHLPYLSRLTGHTITMTHLLSIRNGISTHTTMRSLHSPLDLSTFFATYKDSKITPLDVVRRASRIYKVPPMNVIRLYLLSEGFGASVAKRLCKDPSTAPPDIKAAIQWCSENDATSALNQGIRYDQDMRFEALVEKWLKSHNIRFTNQAALAKEQIEQFGRSISTPDFLLPEPIQIVVKEDEVVDGKVGKEKKTTKHTIHWIDAKNFLYTPVTDSTYLDSIGQPYYKPSFMDGKIRQQAERYNKLYGPGALVFSQGFVMTHIPNTLLLDGSFINAKK
jgi:hypothetical protein